MHHFVSVVKSWEYLNALWDVGNDFGSWNEGGGVWSTEPGARSVQTYKNVKRLAKDLGITQVKVVANKVRNEEDEEFIRNKIPAEDLLGMIHYNVEVMDADRQGKSPYDFSETVTSEIRKIKEKIDNESSL